MDRLNIYLADGTFDGAVIISSATSKFTAVKVKKEEVSQYGNEMDSIGLYFLFVGENSVYVGQSGLNTVKSRIMSSHSGNIDASWHTVIGFMCADDKLNSNELLYMENALCEYVHKHYQKCLTTSPSKSICNEQYRNKHYHLGSREIHSCIQFISDIEFYLSYLSAPRKETTARARGIPSLPDDETLAVGQFVRTAMEKLSASGYSFSDDAMAELCADNSTRDVVGMSRSYAFFKRYDPKEEKGHYIAGHGRYYATPLQFGSASVYLCSQIYEKDKDAFINWYNSLGDSKTKKT